MKRDGHSAPLIGVLMGSTSDWDVMQHACEVLKEFGVRFETRVLAPSHTYEIFAYAEEAPPARRRLLRCRRCCANDGILSSKTLIPVLVCRFHPSISRGSPLLSIVQMPRGVP